MLSRRKLMRLILAAAGASVTLGGLPLPLRAADYKELVHALQAGGLVIVVRHGATATDQADIEPIDFDNIAAQRNLNEQGRAAARQLGEALRQIGVTVGKVYTSKFHRAYETAMLAGLQQIEKTDELTYSGSSMAPDEDIRLTAALRRMLATAPSSGTNNLLVTHKPNIVHALGKDWDDVKEGEASIFRPRNGGYTLVARVQIDEWPRIAAAK